VRIVPAAAADRAAPVEEWMLMNISPIFLVEGRQA
jgi:hypothetical protein